MGLQQPPALTSVTFFAAAAIVLTNLTQVLGVTDYGLALHQGGSLFFVLSGFLMVHNDPDLPDGRARRTFLVAQVARLWPVHVIGIIATIWAGWHGYRAWGIKDYAVTLPQNLLMIQTWLPARPFINSINGPSWVIANEFAFALCFLFLIHNFRRTWWWKLGGTLLLVALLIVAALVAGLPFASASATVDASLILLQFPGARLLDFVIGMCAGLAFLTRGDDLPEKRWGWTVAELVTIALCVLEMRLAHRAWAGPVGWSVMASGMALPAALMIFVLGCDRGYIAMALSAKPFVFLGKISYAIYLLHVPLITVVYFHFRETIPLPFQFTVYLMLLFAVPALTYILIEQPVRRAIVRLGGRTPAQRGAVAAARGQQKSWQWPVRFTRPPDDPV